MEAALEADVALLRSQLNAMPIWDPDLQVRLRQPVKLCISNVGNIQPFLFAMACENFRAFRNLSNFVHVIFHRFFLHVFKIRKEKNRNLEV